MARASAYPKSPVVIVFKPSNHGRSKTRVKVLKTKNIDEVLFGKKLTGVPDSSIILKVGVGTSFIDKFNKKYGSK